MAKTVTVDTTQLAKFLDVTPRHVRRMTVDGVLIRAREVDGTELRGRYDLLDNNVRYIRFLRTQNKLDDSGESELRTLKMRRMSAEAEMSQIRLAQMRGDSHSSADVEFCMTQMVTHFKQHILSVPSRVARRCVGKKFREILTILTTEIHRVLRTLSGYDPEMFAARRDEYLKSKGVDEPRLNGNTDKDTDTDDDSEGS